MRRSTSNSKHRKYVHKVMKIPTQKVKHSCKCTVLSIKRKEGIENKVHINHVYIFIYFHKIWLYRFHRNKKNTGQNSEAQVFSLNFFKTYNTLLFLHHDIPEQSSAVTETTIIKPWTDGIRLVKRMTTLQKRVQKNNKKKYPIFCSNLIIQSAEENVAFIWKSVNKRRFKSSGNATWK